MGRKTLLLGILLVAAVANPTLRGRAMPHVRPYVEAAFAPLYGWNAHYRVKEIARMMQERATRGRPLPAPAELSAYLRAYYRGDDAHLDPWGTPFYLRRDAYGTRVGSAGRDRTPYTSDDLLSPPVVRGGS